MAVAASAVKSVTSEVSAASAGVATPFPESESACLGSSSQPLEPRMLPHDVIVGWTCPNGSVHTKRAIIVSAVEPETPGAPS